ncbi:hypothetical protein [Aliarcobacter butzleri]|uniref:hypothetical protein n=1 Tax=Aliarcobacter butzleri TaxID=28197 RepID=UPI002B249357|nr:hypothetical protein [Aliarcobacter butzleri]
MKNEKCINEILIELGKKEDLLFKQFGKENKCKKFCDFLFKLKNKFTFWRKK